MSPRFPACATFVADTKNVSDFVQKHFVSATNVPQFAAAQETSWATMCTQECVLVYPGLRKSNTNLCATHTLLLNNDLLKLQLNKVCTKHVLCVNE